MKIFPELPEDPKALTDDELKAAISEHEGLLLKVKARDEDTLGELTMSEVLEQAKEGKAAYDSLKALETERVETESQFDELLANVTEGVEEAVPAAEEAAAEVAEVVAEAEAATEEAAAEPVAEEATAEIVLASGNQRAARPRPPKPSSPAMLTVEEAGPPVASLVASGQYGAGVNQGDDLTRQTLQDAMCYAWQHQTGKAGVKQYVARADWGQFYPANRKLDENMSGPALLAAIDGAMQEALTASGGLCAPVTPYYALQTVAVPDRPVRDSMAPYAATRGGLQFGSPLGLSDIAAGVGIKTEAQDALGGTNAVKDCLFVECPDFSTVYLNMIYECFQFGNLNSRAFPEMVTQVLELGAAYHARVAETSLLDYMSATSTAVTQAQIAGAVASLLDAILFAAAGMRSRLRMAPNARLRVLLPSWVRDLLAADTVNSQFYRGQVVPGDVAALLRSYGVEPSFYLDGPTGAGQIFGAQSAGVLLDFPNTVVWYIYPEGSYLFLDGGTLDLGVVRDSTLNSTNDFEYFLETFEAAAFIGVESLKVTSTVCYSGTTAGTTTISCS